MYNIEEFYPTPLSIINKMLDSIDFKMVNSVLEPSAGKGDLVEAVARKMKYASNSYNNKDYSPDIDCIEVNENLRHILKGKGFRVVHDDFLTYNTFKQYSLIVMNPPFSDGDQHLLKALDLQQWGGQIVCLLNAETLKKPFSNTRKDLLRKLEDYNADIQYIKDAFLFAERKTNVEIALIRVNIPEAKKSSYIYEKLKQEENYKQKEEESFYQVAHNDFLKSIVDQYNLEVKAGVNLINEYKAMSPYILREFDKEGKSTATTIELTFDQRDRYSERVTVNEYIKKVRYKYWSTLFNNPDFTGLLTDNLRQEYYKRVNDLVNYDFSLYNIYSLQLEMSLNVNKGVEETILALFEEFSQKHSWYDETSKNIHYYNGWKTNESWKINKKIIIPLSGYYDIHSPWGRYNPTDYKVINKLSDIEKVFNYLDGGRTEYFDMEESLKLAEKYEDTRKIPLKYFTVSFYKKGTCHIEFIDLDLLKKFNIFGSCKKGWLPPIYGKASYKDMNDEEKSVINEFEGREEYEKTMADTEYFLFNTSNILALNAGSEQKTV